MPPTIEDEALHQLQHEQSQLLDKIDELRTIGVGGLVELPQLIVCGNQSSGKSSVLEAISRVRFPVKGNVCTRFATEVILRRNPSSKIKISIEPGSSREDEQERLNLRSFTHDEFSNNNDLGALIERAKERMGITESFDSGFSDDVLKVEISGPDKPELTLVDLPGLYYSTSQDQGSQGIKTVHELTEKYMRNSRSIILAVISAKADYHVQRVLNIAERLDPNRERTLGVITHPDIPEANSEEEQTYLQFIKNEKIPLQLGWHALRNRSFKSQEFSDDARDEREKTFFNQGRWTSLSRECVGIDSLRRRLSSILLKHIRRNLPNLIADIQEKVSDRERKLFKLGPARPTLQQQRGFLLNISGNFERITGQALNGLYTDEFFGGLDDTTSEPDFRRLRAVIRNLNEGFADTMARGGSRRKIIETHDYLLYPTSSGNNHVHRHVLEREVSDQARTNRGVELPGSANQFLVGSLFRDQSMPWEGLANGHLMQAWESARYFVMLVLRHFSDSHTCYLLVSSVIESELEKLKQALLDKLAELTAYTKRGHPLPVGKSFLTQIQKARSERQLQLLKGKLGQFNKHNGESGYTAKDIEQATLALESSRDEFAAAEIIDQMQAYYETAIVTFVDNVATLGIENSLLDPLQRIFTSQVINNMEDDQVRELAAEPSYIREERDRLMSELAKLQAGLRTLNIFNTQTPSLGGRPLPTKEPVSAPFFPSLSKETSNLTPAKSGPLFGGPFALPEQYIPNQPKSASPSGLFSGLSYTTSTSSAPDRDSRGGFGTGSSEQVPSTGAFGSSTSSRPAEDSRNGFLSTPKPPSAPFGASNTGRDTTRFGTSATNTPFEPSKSPSTKGKMRRSLVGKPGDMPTAYSEQILFVPPFDKYSPEELRLGDYERGDKMESASVESEEL